MTTLTLSNRQLRQLVEPVAPFAHTDGPVHALECIRLRSLFGGVVTAEAVGDLQAGLCRRLIPAEPGFDVVIPAAALTNLIALTAGRDGGRSITFTPEGSTVTVIAHAGPGAHATALKLDTIDVARFPDLPAKIGKAIAGTAPAGSVSVDPGWLGEFRPAHAPTHNTHGAPLVIHLGQPGTAVLVTCGDHFIGLMAIPRAVRRATKIRPPAPRPPSLADWSDYLA